MRRRSNASTTAGWAVASLVCGLAMAWLAMSAAWRPILALEAPPGTLGQHASYWAKSALHASAHSVFASDAAFYQSAWASWSTPQRWALIWRCALGLCAFIAPWIALARPCLRPRDGLIHLRGPSRTRGAEAVDKVNKALRDRAKRGPDHPIAPGVPYPSELWTTHLLLAGGTGSGKSTALMPLIDRVVSSGEQLLLFDPKGEFTRSFGRPEIIAPWDSRSLVWDIAKDMRNPLDMRRLAASIVADSHDPMWSNASRQLLVGLMIHLRGTRGLDWGWRELAELCALPQADMLLIMRDWHPQAVRAVEKASVTTAGVLINLASFCSVVFDLAEAWGDAPRERRVGFADWAMGKSRFPQIIMQGHGAYAELTSGYVEGIVGTVSAMVNSVEMRDDPSRKVWVIADEFPKMGKIPIGPLFDVGRSRGYRCVVAFQDFAQIEEVHGAPMVKTLMSLCGAMIIGRTGPGETAERLCKALGSRESERVTDSTPSGSGSAALARSFAREEVPLYSPSELASRLGKSRDGKSMVLVLCLEGEAYELSWPIFPSRYEREAIVPAPWTSGEALWSAPCREEPQAEAASNV